MMVLPSLKQPKMLVGFSKLCCPKIEEHSLKVTLEWQTDIDGLAANHKIHENL